MISLCILTTGWHINIQRQTVLALVDKQRNQFPQMLITSFRHWHQCRCTICNVRIILHSRFSPTSECRTNMWHIYIKIYIQSCRTSEKKRMRQEEERKKILECIKKCWLIMDNDDSDNVRRSSIYKYNM